MKVIQIAHTGGQEALHLVDIERAVPSLGQVLVEIRAIGVNFIDIYYREGNYSSPDPARFIMYRAGKNWMHARRMSFIAWSGARCNFVFIRPSRWLTQQRPRKHCSLAAQQGSCR